jgi:hypothetical protein
MNKYLLIITKIDNIILDEPIKFLLNDNNCKYCQCYQLKEQIHSIILNDIYLRNKEYYPLIFNYMATMINKFDEIKKSRLDKSIDDYINLLNENNSDFTLESIRIY